MSEKREIACGQWPSMITADMVAAAAVKYTGVICTGNALYWLESNPVEKGRTTLVRWSEGVREELLPSPWDIRSRVHEYGGGAVALAGDSFYFVNHADQDIYACSAGRVRRLTSQAGARFADLLYSEHHNVLIAVRECHSAETGEVVNDLVSICPDSSRVRVLACGDDFYGSPCLSPSHDRLAWLSWNQPDMPWDQTRLWQARLDDEAHLSETRLVFSDRGCSVFQPGWSPDGRLHFVSDKHDWWQFHRLENDGAVSRLCMLEQDMGLPMWQFGMRTWRFRNPENIVAMFCNEGSWQLGNLDISSGRVDVIDTPYNNFLSLDVHHDHVAMVAAGPDRADEVALLALAEKKLSVCSPRQESMPDPAWISTPKAVRFPTTGGMDAFGFHYPPANPRCVPLQGEKPPLIVMTHGGPTGAASASLDLKIQFWTSRGFAVLDVNYRGSTGYGRRYRELLKGKWGIYDVDDVVAGAQYLVSQGLANPDKLLVRGSSAGGYTTLAALTFRDQFAAGASLYGIGDLETLALDTHKFESRYLDSLVGVYPEQAEIYRSRSPLHHAEQLTCPVIFLQGTDDRVVPPEQAIQMAQALERNGVYHEIYLFEGEQHGFRKAETIVAALEKELKFYNRIFTNSQATENRSVGRRGSLE